MSCPAGRRRLVTLRPNVMQKWRYLISHIPGNFSFSRSLLITESIPVSPSLLVATSYDSEEVCCSKYPEAKGTVLQLRTLGATVHFGVDATRLDKHKEIKKHTFDNIVFNFPHVGEISRTSASYQER
jgi:rRNA (uridine-N3-)-methyltransferase BTM5-like